MRKRGFGKTPVMRRRASASALRGMARTQGLQSRPASMPALHLADPDAVAKVPSVSLVA
jgi:hypothetical protein